MEPLALARLSVILPLRGNRAWAELAARSIFDQPDPIGTEIVAVDGDPSASGADYLRSVFPEAMRDGKLSVMTTDSRTGDWGQLKNLGAGNAQGAFLAFLHPGDTWDEAGLRLLQPLLYGNDLIIASPPGEAPRVSAPGDAVRAMLEGKRPLKSSMIIQRALFDEVGGFKRGYSGTLIPSKLPGDENLELWLKALAKLQSGGKRGRFAWVENRYVSSGTFETAGITGAPPAVRKLAEGFDQIRQTVSWIKSAPALPREYWPLLGRKAVGAVKSRWKSRKK